MKKINCDVCFRANNEASNVSVNLTAYNGHLTTPLFRGQSACDVCHACLDKFINILKSALAGIKIEHH